MHLELVLYALALGCFAALAATIALTPPEVERRKITVLQVVNGGAWLLIMFSIHLHFHG